MTLEVTYESLFERINKMLEKFKLIRTLCSDISKMITPETDPDIRRKLAMITREVNEAIDLLEKTIADESSQ